LLPVRSRQRNRNIEWHPKFTGEYAERERKHEMAKLTTKARKDLPKRDFAVAGRKYPVEDKAHARAALSRVAKNGSPKEKAEVKKKVGEKYPKMEHKEKTKKTEEKRPKMEHKLKAHPVGAHGRRENEWHKPIGK
jgi:hypothetical protein